MGKSELKKVITKKLKDKWGYSKNQIDVYWQQKKDFSIEQLKQELARI